MLRPTQVMKIADIQQQLYNEVEPQISYESLINPLKIRTNKVKPSREAMIESFSEANLNF